MGLFARIPRLVAAVILCFSLVGYALFVHDSHIDRNHLSSLVIKHTGVQALKPKPAESETVAPAKSAFAEMKKAVANDPSGTGGYGKEWGGSTASGDAATLLVELLPSAAQAELVRSEAVAAYSNTKTLKAAHTTLTSRFTLSTVSRAFGVSFITAKSSTTSATSGTAIAFRIGRVVAVEYMQTSTGGLTRADAVKIAGAEHSLLEQSEADFSLVVSTRPFLPSAIYVLVTLILVALVLVLPGWVGRRRIRRQARLVEQARYEYRARGGKALRRHRPPAWVQPARRTRGTR